MEFAHSKKLILFGDSNTRRSAFPKRWGQRLVTHFAGAGDVIFRGFGGYSSETALLCLHTIPFFDDPSDVELFTISFGSNDCADATMMPTQAVPVAEFRQNMAKIIEFVLNTDGKFPHKGIPADRVLIIAPPPIDDPRYVRGCAVSGFPVDRSNRAVIPYADASRDIATRFGCKFLDTHALLGSEKVLTRATTDGLHLSGVAGKILFDEILRLFPSLRKPKIFYPPFHSLKPKAVRRTE